MWRSRRPAPPQLLLSFRVSDICGATVNGQSLSFIKVLLSKRPPPGATSFTQTGPPKQLTRRPDQALMSAKLALRTRPLRSWAVTSAAAKLSTVDFPDNLCDLAKIPRCDAACTKNLISYRIRPALKANQQSDTRGQVMRWGGTRRDREAVISHVPLCLTRETSTADHQRPEHPALP